MPLAFGAASSEWDYGSCGYLLTPSIGAREEVPVRVEPVGLRKTRAVSLVKVMWDVDVVTGAQEMRLHPFGRAARVVRK